MSAALLTKSNCLFTMVLHMRQVRSDTKLLPECWDVTHLGCGASALFALLSASAWYRRYLYCFANDVACCPSYARVSGTPYTANIVWFDMM